MQRRHVGATTAVLAATVLTAAVAGCGSRQANLADSVAPPIRGYVVTTAANIRCPAGTAVAPGSGRAGQRIPARFTPVAVVVCAETTVTVPGRGVWQAQAKRIAVNGLGPLMSALRARPAPRNPNVMCAAIAISVAWFVLIGRDGKVIHPAIPMTDCALPTPRFLASFGALKLRTISTRLESQMYTQAEVTSGCEVGWKDMLGVDTARHEGMTPSAGGPLFSPIPASIRVCVYRWAPDALNTKFVRGGYVSGPSETELLNGLVAGRTSVGCAIGHSVFAIIEPVGKQAGNVAWIELGGCDRVLRPNYLVGQASQIAIALIENARRG